MRQALFSTEIERRLKTRNIFICYEPIKEDLNRKKDCSCPRCRWFGSTDNSGILAVLDAPVQGAETDIIKRISLCEHSGQNINLFAGEYLKKGKFCMEAMIDDSRNQSDGNELLQYIERLLEEMHPQDKDNVKPAFPAGWFRIGATAGCAGQMAVHSWKLLFRNGGRMDA